MTQASVAALARLNDGRLAVGGLFSNAGDAARSRLAIWTGTSWASLSVADIAMTGSETVAALAVRPDGHLIIGGSFDNIGPTAASNIGRWDGISFFAMASGLAGPVFAIGMRPDSTMIVGGSFLSSGGNPMSNLARWTGTFWVGMGSGTDGPVLAVHINPLNTSQTFIGGSFVSAGGVVCRNIARTNQNGNAYFALSGGVHNEFLSQGSTPSVRTIVQFAPGVLFAGGFFTSVHTSQMRSIAKWNGGVWSAITPGLSASVRAIDVDPSGGVLLGGSFTNTPSGAANRVATWSAAAGFGALGQGADDSVHAVKRLHDNDVVIAGSFDHAGGVPAFSVARYSSGAWSPLGSGFLVAYEFLNKTIAELPVGAPNLGVGDLFVGGDIDGYPPETTVFGLNVLSFNGTSWFLLEDGWGKSNSSDHGFVAATLVLPDGTLILGGSFDNVGGFMISHCVGRWNPATYQYESLGNTFNAAVHRIYALARMPNGDVIAAGQFTTANGGPGNAIARWNGSAWLPLGPGLTGTVYALTVAANGDLIAGGQITIAGSTPVNNIARWNGTTWSAMGDGVRNTVRALATHSNGNILVGGDFARAGGKVSAYFARWSDNALPAILEQPLSQSINCNVESPDFTIAVDPGTSPTYQWYFNNNPINNDGKYEITTYPGGSRLRFNLLYLYDTDAGDYHVVATTPCGSVTSDTASLIITGNCPAPCPGDLNDDRTVDDTDFVLFAQAYDELLCSEEPETECPADLNGDQIIDDADFVLFVQAYDTLICP
ncbi:MAG: hypothetical protein J0L78_08905 [Planctomycetes bacterium]|nr:hypothetical protein [Planctomycetota bacterium]